MYCCRYIYIVISVGNNLSVSRRIAEIVWQFISKILIQISSICKDNVTHIYLQSTTPTYNQTLTIHITHTCPCIHIAFTAFTHHIHSFTYISIFTLHTHNLHVARDSRWPPTLTHKRIAITKYIQFMISYFISCTHWQKQVDNLSHFYHFIITVTF